jgi:CubicO group peptidase (beta-lactamase class C family)
MLSHRTGMAGNDLLWYRAPWSLDETFRRAAKLPAAAPFRSSYQYSSIMVSAAGRAAAARAGKPWEQLVREKISGPLGMTGVVFTTKEIPARAKRAGGHTTGKGGTIEPCAWYETTEPNPAGSICLTAKDLEKWLKFQLGEGKPLLSAAALAETHAPITVVPITADTAKLNPDTNLMCYALGWAVYDYRGHLAVGHGGHIDGFKALVTLFPKDGLAIGVLSNRFETRMNQALSNNLADTLLGLPAKDWDAILGKVVRGEEAEKAATRAARAKQRQQDVKPAFPLDRYAGDYVHPAYGTGTVRVEKGRLVWLWSSFRCELEPWQAEQFRITNGPFEDQLVEFRTKITGPAAVRFQTVVFERK